MGPRLAATAQGHMLIPGRFVRGAAAAAAAVVALTFVSRPARPIELEIQALGTEPRATGLEAAHRLRRRGDPAEAAYSSAALRSELNRTDREWAAYWRAALALRAGRRGAREELTGLVDEARDVDVRLRAASLLVTHARSDDDARAVVQRLEASIARSIAVRTLHGERWRRAFERLTRRAAARAEDPTRR